MFIEYFEDEVQIMKKFAKNLANTLFRSADFNEILRNF